MLKRIRIEKRLVCSVLGEMGIVSGIEMGKHNLFSRNNR